MNTNNCCRCSDEETGRITVCYDVHIKQVEYSRQKKCFKEERRLQKFLKKMCKIEKVEMEKRVIDSFCENGIIKDVLG